MDDVAAADVEAHDVLGRVGGGVVGATVGTDQAGDQAGAKTRVTDLETAWDDAQEALDAADCQAWTFVAQQIDPVLSAVRAGNPDAAKEEQAINQLLATIQGA